MPALPRPHQALALSPSVTKDACQSGESGANHGKVNMFVEKLWMIIDHMQSEGNTKTSTTSLLTAVMLWKPSSVV